MKNSALIQVPLRRNDDQSVVQVLNWTGILVAKVLMNKEGGAMDPVPLNTTVVEKVEGSDFRPG